MRVRFLAATALATLSFAGVASAATATFTDRTIFLTAGGEATNYSIPAIGLTSGAGNAVVDGSDGITLDPLGA